MAMMQAGTMSIEVDEDGFMQAPELWSEEVAQALAATESVPVLGEEPVSYTHLTLPTKA